MPKPKDNFQHDDMNVLASAVRHEPVVPSDNDDFQRLPRALKCIADGVAAVVDARGTVVNYPMLAGDVLEFRAVRVNATGTTATLVAWE